MKLQQVGEDCLLPVRLHPGARKNAITGEHDGALKMALTAPPVDGKANEALLKFVAEWLGIAPSRVQLRSGQTSRTKVVLITRIPVAEVAAKIAAAAG
ncbi:DUF167 domain-containing protein [Terriglobus tenax]|uniref:DUF167 domain-containing protein n=1 Tax=Terriglobus tenax TaxID=1111115 RepID=UPI0021DF7F84|nr:DUF167 domain-containing protein [Terriglobus tenax]